MSRLLSDFQNHSKYTQVEVYSADEPFSQTVLWNLVGFFGAPEEVWLQNSGHYAV